MRQKKEGIRVKHHIWEEGGKTSQVDVPWTEATHLVQ